MNLKKLSSKSQTKGFLFILAAAIAVLLCVFLASCAGSADSKDSGIKIKVCNGLPEIPAKSIGLGDLVPASSSDVDPDLNDSDIAKKYTLTAREYYQSPDKTKEAQVSHYKNVDGVDLETFTQIKSFSTNTSYTGYRMANSEMMEMANAKVQDGYFVKMVKEANGTNYLVEQAVFPEDKDFAIVSLIFKCEDVAIPNSNVHVQIPIVNDAEKCEVASRTNSASYSYLDKYEIPTITYYEVNQSFDDLTKNYESSYNSDVYRYDNNGANKMLIAKEMNVEINGTPSNVFTIFFESNGKTFAYELREQYSLKTYAFNALADGLHFAENTAQAQTTTKAKTK